MDYYKKLLTEIFFEAEMLPPRIKEILISATEDHCKVFVEHLNYHKWILNLPLGDELTWSEIITNWDEYVFSPIIERIERRELDKQAILIMSKYDWFFSISKAWFFYLLVEKELHVSLDKVVRKVYHNVMKDFRFNCKVKLKNKIILWIWKTFEKEF